MPKVSVLIPAYNVELYIRECIDSVLAQTLQDFEIVIIDDASTDSTLDILREYEAKDNRIRVYCHEKNKGQSCGRNNALSHATGEYVYMLDADDMIEPFMLEELYNDSVKNNLDIVGFETKNFSTDKNFEKNVAIKTITYDDTDVLDGREALIYCMENETFSLSTPTFFMRRDYLNDNNIRVVEGILHEDVGYIFELIVKSERARFVHRTYFLRRIRANSTMTKGFTAKNIEGYLKSFYKPFDIADFIDKYSDNERFILAVKKYQRESFGRLNQLYCDSVDAINSEKGGNVSPEIERALEMVKLSWGGLLPVRNLPERVYLCGTGSYTERAIRRIGLSDTIIEGIIVLDKNKNAFRGYKLIEATDAKKDIPVVMSVSRYFKTEYKNELEKAGIYDYIVLDF